MDNTVQHSREYESVNLGQEMVFSKGIKQLLYIFSYEVIDILPDLNKIL